MPDASLVSQTGGNQAQVTYRSSYCSGVHCRHSPALIGDIKGGLKLKRTTPSEVAQKFRVPESAVTGLPMATNSLHMPCLQVAVVMKRYPDFVHQALAVQLEFPNAGSIRRACCGEAELGSFGSGPSDARSRA